MSLDSQVGVAAIMLITLLGLGLTFICKPLWAKLQASTFLHDLLTTEQIQRESLSGNPKLPLTIHHSSPKLFFCFCSRSCTMITL